MPETKLFEVRDRATCIPVIAIRPSIADFETERWLWGRGGFGSHPEEYVLVAKLDNESVLTSDPYKQGPFRTMLEATKFIRANFADLETGNVIDIEFILGETDIPKESDRFYDRSQDGCTS